jgi:hypothetical protein
MLNVDVALFLITVLIARMRVKTNKRPTKQYHQTVYGDPNM